MIEAVRVNGKKTLCKNVQRESWMRTKVWERAQGCPLSAQRGIGGVCASHNTL